MRTMLGSATTVHTTEQQCTGERGGGRSLCNSVLDTICILLVWDRIYAGGCRSCSRLSRVPWHGKVSVRQAGSGYARSLGKVVEPRTPAHHHVS